MNDPEIIIDDGPSTGHLIERIFAYIAVDETGEGVMAMETPRGWMPLIGADIDRIESLREYAQAAARKTSGRIKLVRFDTRTVVEVFE